MDTITQIDFNILYAIQNALGCDFMDFIMPLVTYLTEGAAVWILAAVLFLIFKKYRATISIAGGILASLLVGNLLLKNLVARDRPCWIDTTFELLISSPTDYSFPSAHSMISFAAATAIFCHNKKIGAAALVIAALIAFSRLYLFVHFPSDVLVGSVIGVGLGIASSIVTNKAADKVNKSRAEKKANS